MGNIKKPDSHESWGIPHIDKSINNFWKTVIPLTYPIQTNRNSNGGWYWYKIK